MMTTREFKEAFNATVEEAKQIMERATASTASVEIQVRNGARFGIASIEKNAAGDYGVKKNYVVKSEGEFDGLFISDDVAFSYVPLDGISVISASINQAE